MPNQTVISASEISIAISGKTRLHSLSVNLIPGEIFGLMGPNGAGKTTLLRTLTGELEPTTGHVRLQGKAMHEWPLDERAKIVSVMPQYTRLDFDFSETQMELESRGIADMARSRDGHEGIQAFLAKRKPEFTGE